MNRFIHYGICGRLTDSLQLYVIQLRSVVYDDHVGVVLSYERGKESLSTSLTILYRENV